MDYGRIYFKELHIFEWQYLKLQIIKYEEL